jgi:hypothetical protein
LRDFKPELEQFPVDARRSPTRVLDAHLSDQRPEVRLDLRPPSLWARFPTPVAAKARPMPPHERLRLNDRDDLKSTGTIDTAGSETSGRCSSAGPGLALYAAKLSADVGVPHSLPQAGSST